MSDLSPGRYWLGANAVMVLITRDGRRHIHRVDGRADWEVDEEGRLQPIRWKGDHWERGESRATWTCRDLSEATEEEARYYDGMDWVRTPWGEFIPTAAMFPGLAGGPGAFRPRLLFLDDWIADYADQLHKLMSNMGIDCVTTNNDDDALALLDDPSQVFHAIVQDLQRPPGKCLDGVSTADGELTGFAFYAHCVRRSRPELPCIFLTAVAHDPQIRKIAADLGRCLLLPKPLDYYELFGALKELM